MKKLILLTAILYTISTSSCYYDKADLIYTQSVACDTSSVKYASVIAPMLNVSCNMCHGGSASAGAGIALDNYAAVKVYVSNGRLLNSILQNGQASAMPKGGGKMDACSINKVSTWIKNGALNN